MWFAKKYQTINGGLGRENMSHHSGPETIFITGTDTDAGKTIATSLLLRLEHSLGLNSVGLKPLASGCVAGEHGLRNSDALLLQWASGVDLAYDVVNPITVVPAVSPHFDLSEREIFNSVDQVGAFADGVLGDLPVGLDTIFVEGVGGVVGTPQPSILYGSTSLCFYS